MFTPAKHGRHVQGHCPLLLRRWLRALDQAPGRSVQRPTRLGSEQRPGSWDLQSQVLRQ